MSTDPKVEDDNPDDSETKLDYLKFAYQEVLDATKHQDDKIGRLLTVIAFLTAGSLALANLGGQKIVAIFDIRPFIVPAGMLSLTVFLLSIFLTVTLLISSFATPLRLPGSEPSKQRAEIEWAGGIKSSQIYFSEIAKISVDDWQRKWQQPTKDLKRERFQSLVHETHNLSVRTNFKYHRTTEALAVFAISLMAFALAVSFVYIATTSYSAGTRVDPIEVGTRGRILLAMVLAVYAGVQLLSRARYRYQAVDETTPGPNDDRLPVRVVGERLFAVTFPSFIFLVAWLRADIIPTTLCLLLLGVLGLAAYATFAMSRDGKIVWHGHLASLVALGLSIAGSMVGVANNWYGMQLLTAVVSVSALIGLSALTPTFTMRRYRVTYRRDHPPKAS